MLAYDPRASWIWYISRIRGSAFSRIRFRLLAVFVISVILTYLHERSPSDSQLTLSALSLMGLALGIFLGFRNNTSYDRFWEGRKLWGLLVNNSRSLAREVVSFVDGDSEATLAWRKQQVYRLIAYVHSLRMHLRGAMDWDELATWLDPSDLQAVRKELNVPNAIARRLAQGFRFAAASGDINDYQWVELERRLVDLSNIQGGCERIKSTPIPYSYSVLIHRIVAVYVFSLPFALVDSIHLATPLVVLAVAYTFLGLDAVGSEIEDPFGTDLNDLPLFTLCRMIEVNLRQTLDETEVPPLIQPDKRGYLP